MRIAIATSVLLAALASTPAEADPSFPTMFGSALAVTAGVIDGIPSLVFAIDDVVAAHGTGYGVGELAYNAAAGTAYVQLVIYAQSRHELAFGLVGSTVHGALALHGLDVVADRRHWSTVTRLAAAGTLVSGELRIDSAEQPHGVAYRLAEVAINSWLAAGYGYRAYVDGRADHAALATLAATGGALAVARVVESTFRMRLDIRAAIHTELEPMLVSDGHDVALGVGVRLGHRRY